MANMQTLEFPGSRDLLSQIRFESDQGKVWLNEQRMLLIHSSVMGLLRKELIETLGIERAKGFLMRFGYHSGWKDAELVAKIRPDMSKEDAFFVGPQLHCIKGMVKVKPVALDLDMDSGHIHAEFDWFDSYEADVHPQDFGPADEPICWTLIGYASGYTTYFMGRTTIFKETACAGMGADHCHIIPPDLIEADLFGVEKGAYTGATQSREGKFERAHGGTIFLDEVIELSPRAQASLLRVLQENELERVGDNRTRQVDVRVVAATNEDLEQAVSDGRFRADLFFRLNVYPVHIPPLRERTEDIPLLVNHFLEKYHTLYNKRTLGVSDMAMQALMHYKWPGNIRELENMIERGVILSDNNHTIDLDAFFPSLSEPTHPLNSINRQGILAQQIAASGDRSALSGQQLCEQLLNDEFSLEQLEEQLIRMAMARADGNVSRAARLLGMTRPQLAYRLKKLEPT